jgi:hypothetical protein
MTAHVEITNHAVNRYQERVKPTLDWGAAKRELTALTEIGEVVPSLPWLDSSAPDFAALIELSDGIAMALTRPDGVDGYIGTTVFIRGGVDEKTRAHRAEKNKRKRHRRRTKKRRKDGRAKDAKTRSRQEFE